MTRRAAFIALGCGVLALAFVASTVLQQPSATEDSSHGPTAQRADTATHQQTADERALRKLSERVSQLQLNQAALGAQLMQQTDNQTESEHEQPEGTSAATPDNELESQNRERIEHIVSTFEQHLDEEAIDPSWSPKQLASISDAFAQPAQSNTKLLGSRCAATMCKVELMHETQQAAEVFVASSGMLAPFAGTQGFYRVESTSEAGVKMAFYVARAGHPLPAF